VRRLLLAFPEAARPQLDDPALDARTLAEPLSKREVDVLGKLAAGRSAAEIAQAFVVSEGTIKTHIKNIYRKLAAHNRVQALARARELGLVRD
jgi:LuxR family transcriptional regulator, maltose regulon positive regulatory protein